MVADSRAKARRLLATLVFVTALESCAFFGRINKDNFVLWVAWAAMWLAIAILSTEVLLRGRR